MDLEEVKVCLRSLISSNPISYQVNSLLIDFESVMGFNLPLFGHLNPVEFLRSIDDTVKLQGDPHNPEVVLVESKKSAHIISLVDRQRVNEKIKPKNLYFMNKHRRNVIPVKNTGKLDSSEDNYLSSNTFSHKQSRDRELNISLLTPINFQNLSGNTVKKPNKKPILQLPETNLYARVPLQPKPAKSPQPETAKPPLLTTPMSIFLNKNKTVDSKTQNTIFNVKITSEPSQSKKPLEQLSPESADRINNDNCYFEDVSDNDSCLSIEMSKSNLSPNTSTAEGFINNAIINKLQKLIKNYPEGLWCCELPELFFKEFHFVLDYREFGYTSLIQMLSELPNVFRCVRPGSEDWIVFDASVPPSEEEKKILDFQLKGDMMYGIKANIQKLLAKFCENSSFVGVELDKIADLYQKMFGTSLEFHSLGFKDMKSLLQIWEGNILNFINVGGKLFCTPAFNGTAPSPVRWEEALPPITAENDIFVEIFPKEVVGPEENFVQLDLSRHIAVGHVVEVCVAEVWSPSKFFIQLNKFKNRLNHFMDDIQKFYNVHLNKYKMPDSTLRPNQICVGLYNADPEFPDEWHRAQIIKVINEKTVLINFVDYGTVTRVKKSQLRFLHRCFQTFPVQAFQAQLSGVVPPNDEAIWPMTTSKKFLELLRVPYLNAEMVDIDFKKPTLSVILFDPFQQSKPNINKKLVQEKLARPGEPLYFQDEIPETKLPENETKGLSECSSSALAQANESFSKNKLEITDQFLDIDDLNYSTLFQFKMINSTRCSSPSEEKKEAVKNTENLNVSYEFQEIPELNGKDPESEIEEEEKKQNPEDDVKVTDVLLEPTLPELEKEKPKSSSTSDSSEENPKPIILQPDTAPTEQTSPRKSKRFPPGLEHVNTLSDFPEIPFLLQSQDLKTKINILAMELLTKNASIKQVGVNSPALALQIATEMAKAYLSSEVSMNLPMCYNLYSLFSQPFASDDAPSVPLSKSLSEDKSVTGEDTLLLPEALTPRDSESTGISGQNSDAASKTSSPENTSHASFAKVKVGQSRTAESKEYIEEAQIGGKTLHLVVVDNELYLSSEEVVRQFTAFSNREIADRVLHTKKIKTDYRVISKKSDEKVLHALKSSFLPGVVKRKTKKLKIYLLPVAKVMPFLQALGCRTKSFENDILELQQNWEGRRTRKAEVPC